MAITKILNIQESEGRNPATHLKNALEYIQNPDKTEECVLVDSINCLPDTAFEQIEETKNIFHKTGKRQGYHVIISFSPEEKVTAEQAMYVLEHFAKDVLGDDYEAVYAVHTDREHMHGHLIWNSVSMTTGKKYNSPKGNWKNHLQPITNKYCDELGLSIMPAEYSRNPKNISRDKWEKEMSMKEIILRDAKMCAYAAGNVEHFKYLMKRLGYVFKKDAWMEVQAPGFRYYHKLAKLDDMFSEDMLRHHVDMPWMAKLYFYSSDIRGLHMAKLSPFQKKFYAKLYRLRIVEQKRFVVGGAKYTEDLKRFHQLQDEYLLLVNNDIKSVVELVDFISEQEEKIQQIEDRQHEIYRENSRRKRNIKMDEQYREYQICASGQSVKTTLIRLYSIILQTALDIAKNPEYEDYIDPYYTLIGYFNSIRELGGAVRLLDDDIASRIRVVKNKYNSSEQRYLSFEGKKEITSRIPSWEIAQVLEKLAISYDKKKEKQGCYDVVIATNMIAVGMDVDRLGLMSVVGQPKQNSEYIQATSRVGRQHPGIIFTVYNPYRPRDLSNYENFVGFHSQMYRYVEGTTATPFAARARDRVLHALVVSLLRLQVETMADNGGASNINDISDEQIKDIKDKILERVKITAPSSYVDTEKEMDEFINTWKNIAKDEKLYYFVPAVADDKKRLLTYYGEYYGDKEKPTLSSMRDVEQSSTVFYWEGV